jgi:hypothetical protein
MVCGEKIRGAHLKVLGYEAWEVFARSHVRAHLKVLGYEA